MEEEKESIKHETVVLDPSQIPQPSDTKGNIILVLIALVGIVAIIGFYFY